jgi:hypothetical protein
LKVVVGVDVDPVLPRMMSTRPDGNIWAPLDALRSLLEIAGASLPRMTWLIRSDHTVLFSTGDFASGYLRNQFLWDKLRINGHELGWHLHHLSMRGGILRFDPDPDWFGEAIETLNRHFPVRATRIGWDYGSNKLMQRLEQVGVVVDFSALPGNIQWQPAGHDTCIIDWRRCPTRPYYPSRRDYQLPGTDAHNLLEIPITQFERSGTEIVKQVVKRTLHRPFSLIGTRNKTRLMTERWPKLPTPESEIAAFFWHPEDLAGDGLNNLRTNIEALRREYDAEFVTASEAAALYSCPSVVTDSGA